jgi:putative protease
MILAPAGNKEAFLAAAAAGADAIYCGLKHFSARMAAQNFSIDELASLTRLAHDKSIRVYITLNSLIKPDDILPAARVLEELNRRVRPDALIIQDMALLEMARQTGFRGEIHLSTLANVSFSRALDFIHHRLPYPVDCVVLPRELSIDEIRAMAGACPPGMNLEVFIHGALCYAVSGRCYWSSYMGGKSGLRGWCVQPCRRLYAQEGGKRKLFSCQDLSLDVLVKVLLSVPQVRGWKIEGRKKGPHYVYYTVSAYKMLRDEGGDPQAKKNALGLLERALGRRGTHYHFLPQRPQNPVKSGRETASGLHIGGIKGEKSKYYLIPREELLPGDMLRIGYEDEAWHMVVKVTRRVPKKGRLYVRCDPKIPENDTPVFLIDRREGALQKMLSDLEAGLVPVDIPDQAPAEPAYHFPRFVRRKIKTVDIRVSRIFMRGKARGDSGIWLSRESLQETPLPLIPGIWWWLPPVIWPDEENEWGDLIQDVVNMGGRQFVLNAPWQMGFLKPDTLFDAWAGPFCNIANPAAVECLLKTGFKGVILSPELGRNDYLNLPAVSPLPLGIVLAGHWPLCVSRVQPEELYMDKEFVSPKGETAWARRYGENIWVYPNWRLDIREKKEELQKIGFRMFINLSESVPQGIELKKRSGFWNWDLFLS